MKVCRIRQVVLSNNSPPTKMMKIRKKESKEENRGFKVEKDKMRRDLTQLLIAQGFQKVIEVCQLQRDGSHVLATLLRFLNN